MSSEELKPCPFCGGDVSFHKDEECPGCHLIHCGQCSAFFDFATGADPGNDYASVDALRAAIAPMWNARAQPAQQGEAVEVVATLEIGDYSDDESIYARITPGKEFTIADVCEDDALIRLSQHQRILAASVSAGCKVVPVELLERAAYLLELCDMDGPTVRELRAILEAKDE